MADKKIIKIIVERERREAEKRRDARESPKGVIPRRKEDDYLARRKGGAVRFFDLGQTRTAGGDFVTNDALLQYDVTASNGALLFDLNAAAVETFFENLRGGILDDFAGNAPADYFYQLTKGSSLEKSVTVKFPKSSDPDFEARLDELEEWKEKGLTLSAAQAREMVIKPNGAIFNSTEIDFAEMKITTAPTPAADEVEFQPSHKMDVFLMPATIENQVFTTYINGYQTGVTFDSETAFEEALNAQIQLLPREGEAFAEYLDLIAEIGALSAYQIAYAYAAIIKLFPHARAFQAKTYIDAAADPTVYLYDFASISPTNVPHPSFFGPNGTLAPGTHEYGISLNATFFFFTFSAGGLEHDRLKAIIKKGNNIYYVWKRDA
jgi:hypothetical protein